MNVKDFLIRAIRAYQRTRPVFYLSNLFGFFGGCRFYPSCSDYSISAIEKVGAFRGLSKSFLRVLRCGPWSKGGIDLP